MQKGFMVKPVKKPVFISCPLWDGVDAMIKTEVLGRWTKERSEELYVV